jgi:excisionase family DNA binding protein
MDKLLTVRDVAQLIAMTPFGVYSLVHKKRIPAVKISRRCLRFRPEDIDRWLQEKSQGVETAEPKPAIRQERRTQKRGLPASEVNSIVEKTKREVLG